jgi:hypothetical protein
MAGTEAAIEEVMSHRSVEALIGRLVTDARLRRRFTDDPARVAEELRREGIELTAVELEAVIATNEAAIRSLAQMVDRRLRKVDAEPAADLDDE